MKEITIEKKYSEFIEDLVSQISKLLPEDINKLQKDYLSTNIKKAATLMASSMKENEEFNLLDFEDQCFYIQVISEWSFHKEIDLFRSGIPAKYWKVVMQKIWYAMWEVMFACVKNDAPPSVVLSLVERFVNRTYNDAVEELKQQKIIDEKTEEHAKEQSNIQKMAQEYKMKKFIKNKIITFIHRFILAIIVSALVSFIIIKFKTIGLVIILTLLFVYILIPSKYN